MGVRIDGSNDVVSAADGSLTVDGLSLSVTGIITASGGFKVGSAYTAYSNGNVETTGIITTSSGLNVTGGESASELIVQMLKLILIAEVATLH